MSDDLVGYAVLFGWCGFVWGQWWAERKISKRIGDDVGLKLLGEMAMEIDDRRKIVGRALTISVTQRFKTPKESYSLKLEAEGDPQTFVEGEVVP